MKQRKKRIKKRKLNIKRILFLLLFCFIISLTIYKLLNIEIKRIYIKGNTNISEIDILRDGNLINTKIMSKTFSSSIKKGISNDKLIEKVEIKRYINGTLKIIIKEKDILFKNKNEMYILEDFTKLETSKVYNVPIVDFDENIKVYKKFIKAFNKIDLDVRLKISEILYTPSSYDENLFTFVMKDDNTVFIPTNNFKQMNSYNQIITIFEGKGIINMEISKPYFTPY
ncbi:MAG: cell division protein FtsQ/DivIB [Bacilli bacterium]